MDKFDEIAAEKLPCDCDRGECFRDFHGGRVHLDSCPATYQPILIAALGQADAEAYKRGFDAAVEIAREHGCAAWVEDEK
jgi:hypothetical protein